MHEAGLHFSRCINMKQCNWLFPGTTQSIKHMHLCLKEAVILYIALSIYCDLIT